MKKKKKTLYYFLSHRKPFLICDVTRLTTIPGMGMADLVIFITDERTEVWRMQMTYSSNSTRKW